MFDILKLKLLQSLHPLDHFQWLIFNTEKKIVKFYQNVASCHLRVGWNLTFPSSSPEKSSLSDMLLIFKCCQFLLKADVCAV